MKKYFTIISFAFVILTTNLFAEKAETALSYYEKGFALQQKGDFLGATEMYQESLMLNASFSQSWFCLAQCAYELNEYSRALTCCENAEKLSSGNIDILRLKAYCLIGTEDTASAKQIFETILLTYPNDIESMFGLAELKILEGSFSVAENYYLESLSMQSHNKKALLSLALVSLKLNKTKEAENYIKQAVTYHSEDAQVYYFASYVELVEGNILQAEKYANTALRINKDYDEASSLLSCILFSQKKYEKAQDVCDSRIVKNRNASDAWYLKAICCYKLGAFEAAIDALEKTVEINPQDEVARSALEYIACKELPVEDKRRENYAKYHVLGAVEAVEKYNSPLSLAEYIMALKIDPLNLSVRLSYADYLLNEGYPEYSLEQLKFIKSQGKVTKAVDDRIESYESLLTDTIGKKWNRDPLYLNKSRIKLSLYYLDGDVTLLHPYATQFCSELLAESFVAYPNFTVHCSENPVKTYSEAFKDARNNGYDYFGIVKFDENKRENALKLDLYSSKTGTATDSWTCYRTGNKKLQSCVQKIVSSIVSSFEIRGTIIDRNVSDVLIDLGKRDGVKVDDEFLVVKKGSIKFADSGIGLQVENSSELGTVKLTRVGEDLCEGVFRQLGYYDKMNVNDEVIIISTEDAEKKRSSYNPNEHSVPLLSEFTSLLNSIR